MTANHTPAANNFNTRMPLLPLLMLTAGAVLLHGYHVGVQDQAIYLPAIKRLLNPELYPYDAAFIEAQARFMWFDELVATSVKLTHLPLEWVLLGWQLMTIFGLLLGCWRVAEKCFAAEGARWGAVLMVAALLSLPATGTQAPLLDNYLHPRNFSTAMILLALGEALGRNWIFAGAWLATAAAFHPLMAAIGAVHIGIVMWPWKVVGRGAVAMIGAPLAAPVVLAAVDPAWLEVLQTRRHLFPLRWMWYEWLGVIVPLAFLAWYGVRRGGEESARGRQVAGRVAISAALFVIAAVGISTVAGLEWMVPFQAMRGMHLAFLMFFFFVGAWIWEWSARKERGPAKAGPYILLAAACAGMAYWQAVNYRATAHIEWPRVEAKNEWVRAFRWVRENTPRDALFALDPMHMEMAGNDSHGFRALAERCMLADYVKDRAVAGLTPELAARWLGEWRAIEKWRAFGAAHFARLAAERGVTWVIVAKEQADGMECGWRGETLAVCRVRG